MSVNFTKYELDEAIERAKFVQDIAMRKFYGFKVPARIKELYLLALKRIEEFDAAEGFSERKYSGQSAIVACNDARVALERLIFCFFASSNKEFLSHLGKVSIITTDKNLCKMREEIEKEIAKIATVATWKTFSLVDAGDLYSHISVMIRRYASMQKRISDLRSR